MTFAIMGSLITLSLATAPDAYKPLIRLPKMSPMTTRLLARLARRDCDVPELTDLVEKDPLLSAGLLQLANSAAFARLQTIHSLRHAISMIGLGTMRKFALALSVSNLFSRFKAASSFSLTRFNAHSVATGTLTELLAAELPVAYPEEAFLAGMLHDVGKLLIAVNLPRQYDDILAANAVSHDRLIATEREVINMDHAELSAAAIERWELAAPIRYAARFHHEPELAAHEENVPRGKLGLSMLVHQADAFVNHRGFSVLPPREFFTEAPVFDFPGHHLRSARVISRFEAEWKNLSDLFL